ncbi:hypothetical protein [Shewanella pealeana]|nr:hypothetical protein [Shewanella pealeana]
MLFKALVFLFLMYNIKFTFLSGIGSSYIALLFLLVLVILRGKLVNLELLALGAATGLCFLSISMFSLLHPSSDFGLIKFSIIAFISIAISGAVFKSFFYSRPIELFGVFGLAGLINAFLIILMSLSSTFQDLYLSLLIVEAEELYGDGISDGFFSLRMVGSTGFATYSTAFTQCVCVFSYYIYVSYCSSVNNTKISVYNYLAMTVVLISAVIAARTAFVGIAILFVMMMFDVKNRRGNLLFLFVCVLIFTVIISVVSFYFSSERTDFFVNWVTEVFYKGLQVGSVQKMGGMFHFSYYDFSILGESKLNNPAGGYYMGVDIGYLRVLFSAGYFGTLLIALLFITSVRIYNFDRIYIVYTFFLFAIILVFMIKGLIIFDAFYILLYVGLMSHAFKALSATGFRRGHLES